MELGNRTAVITGASRGIGAAMAHYFAERGMRLGLCARQQPVLPDGERIVSWRVDVTDETAVDAFAAEVDSRLGPIDLWINNAGVLSPVGFVRDLDVADFRQLIDINVTGVFLGTRAYVRHLHRHQRPGVLINISSGASKTGYAGWSAYCASKAAVDLLTETVAIEERDIGLRAHSVAPGVIDTDMQALIRSCSEAQFPMVERFRAMKEQDSFSSPAFVAERMLRLAFDPAHREEHDEDAVYVGFPTGK